MTEIPQIPLAVARSNDIRITGYVSAAHFVSHFYILVLPPLFAFVREEYGVSYTELGFALMAFNVMCAVFQTPAGFLADRVGPRIVLFSGLVLGSVAFAVAGIVNSFWVLVAMFALAGLGNAVFHPADYAILSKHVSEARVGQAYSVHTFSGLLGGAVAPASLLFIYTFVGWRGAFIASAILGLVIAAIVAVQPQEEELAVGQASGKPAAEGGKADSWRLLLAPVIMLNFAFFTLLAFQNGGFQNYSVVALAAAHGTPLSLGNFSLSVYLLLAALGVLLGGVLVGRTRHHGLVVTACVLVTAAAAILLALFNLDSISLTLAMGIAGLAYGAAMPSRDMIVRQVTPPGSFGKVFGFVASGFNTAGVIAPMVYGPLMDNGHPQAVFFVVAAISVLSITTIATVRTRK